MIAIMSKTALNDVADLFPERRTLAAGARLFHRDDPVRRMHRVVTGGVVLLRRQASGAALVLQRAGPGDVVAEGSLTAGRYHCDAEATAPTTLAATPVAALRAPLAADPAVAFAWIAYLGAQTQAARMRAEILALRTVAERLDAWTDWRGGPPVRGGWRDCAAEIGVTPEALYRELARRRGDVAPRSTSRPR